MCYEGVESEAGSAHSASESAAGGIRQRPDSHQPQLEQVRQVPRDDVHQCRARHRRYDFFEHHFSCNLRTGLAKKRGHRLMTIILSILNRFNKFFTVDSAANLQLNVYQKSHRTLHMLLHYLVKH